MGAGQPIGWQPLPFIINLKNMTFDSAFFWRVLIAVVGAILVLAIIPPFLRLIGFPTSNDLMVIVRIVVAAVAVFYVIKGT